MNDFLELKIQNWLDKNHLIVATKEAAKTFMGKCRDGAVSLALAASASVVALAPTQVSAMPAASIPINEFQQSLQTPAADSVFSTDAEMQADQAFAEHLADLDSLISKIGQRAFKSTKLTTDPLIAKAASAVAANSTQPSKEWANQLMNGSTPLI